MRLDQVLQRLRHKVAARKEEVATVLLKGQCADFAAYRHLVGEYRGLSSSDDMIKELVKELNQEADE